MPKIFKQWRNRNLADVVSFGCQERHSFIEETESLWPSFGYTATLPSSRYGWMVMLFGTYYESTVLEVRRHQTENDFGQGINGCLSRINQTKSTDYVCHTPALVASQCVRGSCSDWAEELCISRATASNSCRKNIGLSKLSPHSTLYRKAGYSFFFTST